MWQVIWTYRSALTLALSLAGYVSYQRFAGNQDSDQPLRVEMAREVARQAVLDLPIPPGRPLIAISPVQDDFDGIVGYQLQVWTARRNASVVTLKSWNTMLPENLQWRDTMSSQQAAIKARKQGADYALWARVLDWTTDPLEARSLVVEITLVNAENGATMFTNSYSLSSIAERSSNADPTTWFTSDGSMNSEWPRAYRPRDRALSFSLWIFSGFLLPWFASNTITRSIRSTSNVPSAILVLGYLGVMFVLGWFLWVRHDEGTLSWWIIFLLSVVWLGYLEFVCRVLDNRP